MAKIQKLADKKNMKNILSIDLESWVHFYIDALKLYADSENFDIKKLDNNYIPNATENLLAILQKHNQKATFFVLAEFFNFYPKTIEKIEKAGHEIAYHTYNHALIKNKNILQNQLEKSQNFLTRFKPIGFRAPQIFITKESFELLKQHGFEYSSSSYDDFHISNINGIKEIPVSVFSLFNKKSTSSGSSDSFPKNLKLKMLFSKVPFGSGIIFAIFGSKLSIFINQLNKKGIPAIIFLHPWQLYQTDEITNLRFKFSVLLKNPLCFFYTKNRLKSFEKLLQKHQFTTFKKMFFKGENENC